MGLGQTGRAYERLLNFVITFDHLKFSIFAGLANALGKRRTRLYLVENLLAFLAISLRGFTDDVLHIGT